MKRHHHIYLIALCLLLSAAAGAIFAKNYAFKPSPKLPTTNGVPNVDVPSAVPYFVTPPPDSPYVKVYSPVLQHYVYIRVSAAQRLNWYDHSSSVPGWAWLLLGLGVGATAVGAAEHWRHIRSS